MTEQQPLPPPAGHTYGPPVPRTNGMAVASLVCGILWGYGLLSILALVFGYIGRNQIRERGEGGRGLATAGIILGYIGVVGTVLFVVLLVVVASSLDGSGF